MDKVNYIDSLKVFTNFCIISYMEEGERYEN